MARKDRTAMADGSMLPFSVVGTLVFEREDGRRWAVDHDGDVFAQQARGEAWHLVTYLGPDVGFGRELAKAKARARGYAQVEAFRYGPRGWVELTGRHHI